MTTFNEMNEGETVVVRAKQYDDSVDSGFCVTQILASTVLPSYFHAIVVISDKKILTCYKSEEQTM